MDKQPVRKTPLYEVHQALKGQIIDFAGWQMPIQYEGIIKEHLAVRENVGLFDVSHMGELSVKGAGALDFLQYMTVNDVSQVTVGQAQYTMMCYPSGGIVDEATS